MSSLYPSSPKDIPADFTESSTRYQWQVLAVLGSLLLTLVLYLALIAGTAWIVYQLASQPWTWTRRGGGLVFFARLLGLFCSGFLFLYLFKGLFKRQGRGFEGLVEITDKEHPEFFAFLRQLCAETGAPVPGRVYCSHEVNACVFYPTSIFSLIFPRRKNLLIGLGLVQSFNLSELKTVLAHELGHFSQSSMKLGAYVYVANTVLADIVYGRDFFDRFLADMKTWDERVAIFAKVFAGLLGYLRMGLECVYKGINLLNLSLMRQMEFNADRFSVKTAGSDAVGQVLQRCQYADEVWATLDSDLWAAADHKLYSDDIFAHFETASAALGRRKKDAEWGIRKPTIGPEAFLFTREKDHAKVPDMWATHPSNYQRERHAKDPYIAADIDERPAWLLFHNPEPLRQAVSRAYYENVHQPEGDVTLAASAQVQQFLNEEYAETAYGEQYAGYYDDRYLELTDLHCLPTQASFVSGEKALEEIEAIHRSLSDWSREHRQREEEHERLQKLLSDGAPAGPSAIEFSGQPRRFDELPALVAQVEGELEADRKTQADGDARIYLAQLLAKEVGCGEEFDKRYQFHLNVQEMHEKITDAMEIADQVLHYADGCGEEMSSGAFGNVVGGFREAVSRLNEVSMSAMRFRIPPLKNMADGKFLSDFLALGDLMDDLRYHGDCIEGAWIDELLARLGEVEDKLQRLHFKSIGGILALQERIVEQWRQKPAPRAEVAGKRAWH